VVDDENMMSPEFIRHLFLDKSKAWVCKGEALSNQNGSERRVVNSE